MFKTKKGRIIFFVIMSIFIVAVILVVAVINKQPSLLEAQKSFNEISVEYYDETEKASIKEYVDGVLALNNLSDENRVKLANLKSLTNSLYRFEEYLTNNLAFTYRSETYNKEVKELNKAKAELEKAYEDMYSWAHTSLYAFLDTENKGTADVNSYAKLFINRYKPLVGKILNVYECAINILSSSCTRGFAVNDLSVAFCTSMISACNRVLVEMHDVEVTKLCSLIAVNMFDLQDINFTEQDVTNVINAFNEIAKVEVSA